MDWFCCKNKIVLSSIVLTCVTSMSVPCCHSRSSPRGGKMTIPSYCFAQALETWAKKPLLLNYSTSASCNSWCELCCCCSWTIKCPTEIHVDEHGVPAHGAVFEGYGNFRLRSPARRNAPPGKTLNFIIQLHCLSTLCCLTRDAVWPATSDSGLDIASLPWQTVSPQTVRQFESYPQLALSDI